MLILEDSCRAESLVGRRVLNVFVSQLFKRLRVGKKAVKIRFLPSCLPATIFLLGNSIKVISWLASAATALLFEGSKSTALRKFNTEILGGSVI